MAVCRNCGTEIPEGTKFCPNCGAPTGDGQTNSAMTDRAEGTAGTYETGQQISDSGQPSYHQSQPISENGQASDQQGQPISENGQASPQKGQYLQIDPGPVKNVPVSGIKKYSKFFGIALFILAIAAFLTDPPFVTIILSAAVIAGAVFCISRKYKRKGFSIAAIVFAALCLFGGVSQARNYGMFTTPRVDSSAAGEGKNADNNASGQQAETPAPTAAPGSPGTDTTAQGSGKEGSASKDASQAAVMRNSSMSMLHL